MAWHIPLVIVKKAVKFVAKQTLSAAEYEKFKQVYDVFTVAGLIAMFGIDLDDVADRLGVDVDDLEAFLDFLE